MKSVIKILKLFCSKLVNFSNTANDLMEMTDELRSFSTESGMKNFSVRSRVKIRNFSEKALSMTLALEDFSVMSDDMLRECPKENERLARKLRMTNKCFADLETSFKNIENDVKDAVELAVSNQPMSKSAPSNPAETDLQKEDTTIDSEKSVVNGSMPEGTTGDANISGPVESVNNNFSKEEYLKSLFNRIADQYENFSDQLNDAGDLVEEVTDEVVAQESPELSNEDDKGDTCPDCGKPVDECQCEKVNDSVLEVNDNPENKTTLVKTEDELTGEETDKTPGDVNEFCSKNFAESISKDVSETTRQSVKLLNEVAEGLKDGSLKDINSTCEKLDKIEGMNKDFAAITACALICFSEICKECGQVIPGTEKVESSEETTTSETTETPSTELTTETTTSETTGTPSTESQNTETTSVTEALNDADKNNEDKTPTDEEIIINFSDKLGELMDKEFLDAPTKHEGEGEAKPTAGDAPNKKEGQENMTDVAPIHPDAVKIALFSVMDKCDEFKEKKANFADVLAAVNNAKEVMSKSYSTPELCKENVEKFANFCDGLGLAKATEAADDSNATKSAETTVNPVEEGNAKLNGLVETIKNKLKDLDLDSMTKSFATKLCDEFSSTKCFTEEDVTNKMNRINSFSEELEKISGVTDAGTITQGDNATDTSVTNQVELAVNKNDASNEAKNEELNNTELSTVTDSQIVNANFSNTNTKSDSYGSRMLSILGIR